METELALAEEAAELLEKAAANLEPELHSAASARELMAMFSRAEKVASYCVAALARKVNDAAAVAKMTGTSLGRAKDTVATGTVMGASEDLSAAMRSGAVSLDQAAEIAKAEDSAPGAAKDLVQVAQSESFHVLRDRARKAKLEAEQHRGLAERQRAARSARSYHDELGMVHVHLALQPHIGAPIVARAEAEAARLFRAAKKAAKATGRRGDAEAVEPFERHLADAYAALLSGSGKGPTRRPELVVLVSHEVAKRGWRDVKPGEVCKIPGLGPVSPQVAKDIATDAFLSGVLYDGADLRHFKRWTRHIPIEVSVALELGPGPGFDGIRCTDCGARFHTEIDHAEPRANGGPTCLSNSEPRCWPCHQAKTARDRRAGKLTPPRPGMDGKDQEPRRRSRRARKLQPRGP